MVDLLDIGRELVRARKARGLTQRELGARLGVTQPQIARWERTAYRTATLERLSAVATAIQADASNAGDRETALAAEDRAHYNVSIATPDSTGPRALARLGVHPGSIAAFCRLHGIQEMALFGSAVRTDFGPDSDVDLLLTWEPGRKPLSLIDLDDTEAELRAIFRREVHVVDRAAVDAGENPIRRAHILGGARTVHVAR